MAHYVIVGGGRVGGRLATALDAGGHSVAVVDRAQHVVESLARGFGGQIVPGIGFDRDVLRRAGVERAQGLAAVTADDSTNIIAARVARETFRVPHVVARIYDTERARVYQRLGVPTVASIQWTADQVLQRLLPAGTADLARRDATGTLLLSEFMPHRSWWGRPIAQIERDAGLRVSHLTRYGEGILPRRDSVLQEGDVLHAVYLVEQRDRVESALQGDAGAARAADTDQDEEADEA